MFSGSAPGGVGTTSCDVYGFGDPVFVLRDVFSDPFLDQCVARSAPNIRHKSVDTGAVYN